MIHGIIQKVRRWFKPKPVEPASEPAAIRPAHQHPQHGRREEQQVRHGSQRPPRARLPQRQGAPPQAPPRTRPTPRQWDVSTYQVPPTEGKTRFHDIDLPIEIMHAVADLGFQYCTPIQAAVLPKALSGLDVTGRAQTGTGKTAAFLIAIFTHMLKTPPPEGRRPGTPRALVLGPTRELVLQIEKDAVELGKYFPFTTISIFGGMDFNRQLGQLERGTVDLVVATPGRLLDFKERGKIHLSKVEIMIIDEADRMLDMGFIPDVRRIIESTPPKAKRQTMLFSATLTPEVRQLASRWTRELNIVEIAPEQVAVETINQMVYITTNAEKFTVLYNLITKQNLERVIIFANRRDETELLKRKLSAYGINAGLLSGDVEQKQRLRTLEKFRSGEIRVLAATDVAARGLHIEGVSHVINYTLPMNPEDYVHRIGRTGRAGASGISVSFATEDDAYQLPGIEEYLGRKLEGVYPPEEWLTPLPPAKEMPAASKKAPQRQGRRPQHGRRPSRGSRGPSRH